MKIVVITQEDRLSIPRNVQKIITNVAGSNVSLIVALDSSGALVNKKMYFAKGFGAVQSLRMGVLLGCIGIVDAFDRVFVGKLLHQKFSLRAVSLKHRIPYLSIKNPNESEFLNKLRKISPDIIISFSAPMVFHPELLAIARQGCINLHCSYLPKFAGLLPSFWALFHQAQSTGVTVHYMDDKIDNGGILGQVEVPIKPGSSMFSLIRLTKRVGGDLMCDLLQKMEEGESIDIQSNPASSDNYYSWPSLVQMKEFRAGGGRLI